MTTALDKLLQKHEILFKEELGAMKDIQVQLHIKPDAVPKFCRTRSTPYALRPAIEQELKCLEKMGAIERVKYGDWATPVVPIPKPYGTVRLCGDFKITINPALYINQHPIPKAEDLFATLAGGKKFSKLDLSQAYQQMLLHPDDRKYTTIKILIWGSFSILVYPLALHLLQQYFNKQWKRFYMEFQRSYVI